MSVDVDTVTLATAELARDLVAGVDGLRVEITDPNSAGARSIRFWHDSSGYHENFGISRYGFTPAGEIRFGSKYQGADKAQRKVKAAIGKAGKLLKSLLAGKT